jgi:two-component system CheB/CheR fusion protein
VDETEPAFPIVGIGASAGGIEALEGFFRAMPDDPGCCFVIVTHLSRDRRSMLAEIVSGYTAMPVFTAVDGAQVRPNEVHVLPEDSVLSILGGRLRLRKLSATLRERRLIDVFLSALSIDRGESAAGVILSGSDGDGTLGIKAIKERGGLTLAQVADGHPPQYPEMPNHAIASGMVDLAIPVEQMGRHLAAFARSFDPADHDGDVEPGESVLQHREQVRQEICGILRNQLGHDFAGYKERTFMRRVTRRMQVHHQDSLDGYVALLRSDPAEAGALFRDLLINVTNFFRDADAFALLETAVIPKLFEGRGADESIRVWVPGCATGEEVFSIAILLREAMDRATTLPRVQIFATDIDEGALQLARAARYPEALLETVSPERRRRFFVPSDGSFQLAKDVRDMCVFSPHSVIRDPPFSRLDLISCRNLLIYFGPDIQNQVIPTFHYALRPRGYLFLGMSENVSQFTELFASVDKKSRLFRARDDVAPVVRLPMLVNSLRSSPFPANGRGEPRHIAGMALRQVVERQVLDRFAPAHVVVNRDGEVVYYSARTGKYFEAMAGSPSRQVLGLARRGLRLDLRTLLREAIETDRRVTRENLAVENDDGRVQMLNLSIEPLDDSAAEDRLYVVILADVGSTLSRDQAAQRNIGIDEAAALMERELRETRERLQSLIEEYETALEELKSANEELVSVNEELQSTNEELEASKEELQSLNEEMHTVNAELSGKVEALNRANSDLHNLFESTRIATVFLDNNLVIRSYTPAVSQIFNMRPGDRGRPLTDLVSRISLSTLTEDVREVLAGGQTLERRLDHDGGSKHFLLRLAPYRDDDRAIEGVVLTFIDVTSLTEAEAHQRLLVAELNHRVKNMLAVVISIAEQTYRTAASGDFKERFMQRVQAMARSYELLSKESWTEALIGDLIRPQLAPFGLDRAVLSGPDIPLKPKQALSVGMIVHELATNAGK